MGFKPNIQLMPEPMTLHPDRPRRRNIWGSKTWAVERGVVVRERYTHKPPVIHCVQCPSCDTLSAQVKQRIRTRHYNIDADGYKSGYNTYDVEYACKCGFSWWEHLS